MRKISYISFKKDMATEEDKRNQLDVWSRIFQAETWGDLMAIAAENKEFQSTVEQIDRLTADEAVRLQCEARERAMLHEQAIKKRLEKQQNKIEELETALHEQDGVLQEKDMALQEKDIALQEKNVALQEKELALQERDAEITRLRAMLK